MLLTVTTGVFISLLIGPGLGCTPPASKNIARTIFLFNSEVRPKISVTEGSFRISDWTLLGACRHLH